MLSTARSSGIARLGALLLPAALAIAIAACSSAAGAPPSSSPGASPTSSPVATPSPDPTGTPVPSAPGRTVVDLDVADSHHVSVIVDNVTGYPVRVTSGRAGDGMSVRWGVAKVVNVDDSTLRVTWAGLPVDERINLNIRFDNRPIRLTFEQQAPPANSDATGFDRVIILSFDTPVSADEVIAAFSQAG
jgi:hypothetical protein